MSNGTKGENRFDTFARKHKRPLDDIIFEADLAILLGTTQETLWNYRNEKGLPYITIGRSIFYSEKSLVKWMLSQERTNGNGQEAA